MASNIDPLVPTIKALILMDSEGKRIAVKYYTDDLYAPLMFVFTFDRSFNYRLTEIPLEIYHRSLQCTQHRCSIQF